VKATTVGICASAILAIAKIVAGVFGDAYALVADGAESMLDIFSSLVVLGSLRLATAPPNQKYPFGYGRAEPLASLVVALVLLAAAGGIAVQSVREIFTPHHAPQPFTLVVLIIVVAVKELMFRRLSRAGDDIGSSAVSSDAWHHRSDALTSVAAFIGISISIICGKGYESADDWAALAACGVIAFNGVRLFRSALQEVMDVAPDDATSVKIREIASQVDGVLAIDKCRVRKSGLGYFVELHVMVDGDDSVRRGHEIGHRVKDVLLASGLGVLDVAMHVEPA
jgi:cation diffusion facilitator family transporter